MIFAVTEKGKKMKKYEITAYIGGVKKSRIVVAKDRAEAKEIGWELFDADSIYVDEVQESEK